MAFSSKTWFALGAVLVVLLALLGYGQLLVPGRLPASVHSDLLAEHLATQQVLRDSLARGEGLPAWRSDQFSGQAAGVNPQAQYTWPLDLPFWLLPPERAAGLSLFFHPLLMALSCAFLGVALGLSGAGILWLSLCGLFSFKLILALYAGWLPHLPGIVLAPALLAAAIRFASRPGMLRALELCGVGLLLSLAGHFQVAYYTMLLCLGGWLAEGVARFRRGERRWWIRAAGWGGLALLGVVLLSAWRWLPMTAELSLLSRGAVDYDFFRSGPMVSVPHLLTLLQPEILGSPRDASGAGLELWETAAYFGIVPLLLAIPGVALGWRRPGARLLAAGFAASLLFALDTPLLRLPYHLLPGFAFFRLPGRLLFVTALCGTALSGIGLDELRRRLRSLRRGRLLSALALSVLGALVAGEGIRHARRYLDTVPAEERWPRPAWASELARRPGPFRVAPLSRHTMPAGWAARLGLEIVTGYDPWNYRHYLAYADLLRGNPDDGGARVWLDLEAPGRRDLLNALDARFVISPRELPPESDLSLEARYLDQPSFAFYQGMVRLDVWVYRNPRARGRISWAGELRAARTPEEMARRVRELDLDAMCVLLSPDGRLPEQRAVPDDVLRLVSWSPGRLVAESKSLSLRVALISEVWHPGWRASVDGRPAEILRADLALMAVALPAGAHRLELWFEPPGQAAGRWISALSAGGILVAGAVCWRRRRPPPAEDRPAGADQGAAGSGRAS